MVLFAIDIFIINNMGIFTVIKSKKTRNAIIIIISFALLYALLRLFLFDHDPVIPIVASLFDKYLFFAEQIANVILFAVGSTVHFDNHTIIMDGVLLTNVYTPEIRYKKIAFFLLLIIWFTKANLRSKTLFSIITILTHFLAILSYNTVGAYLSGSEYYDPVPLAIPNTLILLSFIFISHIWYFQNKKPILEAISKTKFDSNSIEKKANSAFVCIYLYLIIGSFLLLYFTYEPWINLIFTISQKILTLFGYDAFVEPFLLVGNNGSIYMAKYCLGFKIMYLFAAIIYMTGRHDFTRWIYIFAGLIFLNFVNILRFVFLFIHIQKNSGYVFAIDLHDLYNYIIYSMVFILWVIWFECFSDIKGLKLRRKQVQKQEVSN